MTENDVDPRDTVVERGSPHSLTEDHIRSLLLARRARSALFGKDLFSDPAWDILLELHAAKLAGHGVALLDLAKAIETPVSTVGRWIGILKERGLVQSSLDADSVHFFTLTQQAASQLEMLGKRWATGFGSI
jgi:DNA-binding MarR family transcriptional regulator